MLFVNTTHPFLSIFNPATGGYAQFQGGKLEIEEDDPNYAVVMAEASKNPLISIMVNATTCPDCGEVFAGKTAKAQLGTHRKSIHFASWVADQDAAHVASIQKEIKARAGFACDVCSPIQTFGNAKDLAEHVTLIHATAPVLGENGEDTAATDGGSGGGAVVSSEIPAAAPSKK